MNTLKPLIVLVMGFAALGVTELPLDDFTKLGVAGACIFLLWWAQAKTLPAVVQSHADSLAVMTTANAANLASLTAAYRQSVGDLRDLHHETSEKLCEHLDSVRDAIDKASDRQFEQMQTIVGKTNV